MAEGLERFVAAQDEGGTFERAVAELAAGRKRGHWMWFVFPQVAGLGFTATNRRYAIRDLGEARAYLAHPELGPRLLRSAAAAERAPAASAVALLGAVDALKLRSSMTLFGRAATDEPAFPRVLDRWYGGKEDPATLALL